MVDVTPDIDPTVCPEIPVPDTGDVIDILRCIMQEEEPDTFVRTLNAWTLRPLLGIVGNDWEYDWNRLADQMTQQEVSEVCGLYTQLVTSTNRANERMAKIFAAVADRRTVSR